MQDSALKYLFQLSNQRYTPLLDYSPLLIGWSGRPMTFGILFVGHPNLKRILNVDEMDYFPLRKEFPLEDQTRIDKDDEMFGRGEQ